VKTTSSPSRTTTPAAISRDDLVRLGYCISNFVTSRDRIDRAEVWETTSAEARAALKDIVPADDPSGPKIFMILLTGKIESDVWTGSEWKVEDNVFWTTPTFDSMEPLDVGSAACNTELTQSGVPEHKVDRAILGDPVELPLQLIPESPNE
jgi:hypothetical protein